MKRPKALLPVQHLVALEGWIETAQLDALKAKLQREFGEPSRLTDTRSRSRRMGQVPIKLKNNALVEPSS